MSATPNINGEKIKGSITGITLFSATTISGGTFYGDGSNLTGISELYVTGGTFSNGNLTLINNSGGTFVVSGSAPYNSGLITNATGWTDNGNGTLDLPQVQVALYDNPNFIEPLRVYTIPSGTTGSGGIPNLFDEDTNYIVIEYNGGNPIYNVYNNDGVINDSDIVLYMITYRTGNFIHVLEFDNYGAGLPNKINDRILSTDRFARESGFSLGLSGSTGVITLSAGVAWNGVYRQQLPSLNSQDDVFFQSFHSGGTWVYTTTGNTLNNEYYDDGTDKVLATAGKYLVNWYFRGQEVNDHLYEVWGNDEYDSVADAQLSVEPLLPELITSHAFLTGRIIVQVSATTGYVESAFVRVFQSTQVTNHNDLLGLQGGSPGEYYHLSSSEYNNNAYTNVDNNFSVGQTFNNGLTADTISATTYFNLPTDVFVTGGTYSAGTATFTNNSGGTFDVNGFLKYFISSTTPTGVTDGDRWFNTNDGRELVYVTDQDGSQWVVPNGTSSFFGSLSANTISATTYLNLPIDPDTYITGFSYNNNEFIISDNSGNSFNTIINDVTGLTINGDLNVTGNTTLNDLIVTTISATTYQNLPPGSFGITIDGGGSDITTGNKGYAIMPYNGTITGWSVIGNTSGSCVIDVWKTTSGNIPTVLDTITGTEKPTLSSQQINSDLNLTTWTTSVSQYDVIGFNVDSTIGLTRVNLSIYIIKQ